MLIDLNVHSDYSRQGVLDPEEIILRAKQVGLDGLCFTEDRPHNRWKDLKKLGEVHDVVVFVGLEITTDSGHCLLFPPTAKQVEPGVLFEADEFNASHLSFSFVQKIAEKAEAVLVAAHPYHLKIEKPLGDRIFSMKGLGGIEVRNAGCASLINDFALEASFHLKLPGVGGSDTSDSLENLGKSATLFQYPIQTEADLVRALGKGDVWPVELTDNLVLRDQSETGRRSQNRDRRPGGRDRRPRDNRRPGGRATGGRERRRYN